MNPATATAPARLLSPAPECGAWALTPYPRCSYRCVYCITGAQGRSAPAGAIDDLVVNLRQELADLGPAARVTVGGFSDAYPPVEAELGVTRRLLEVLVEVGQAVSVVTKGTGVLRDVDLLVRLADVRVSISLCSLDDAALARLDPVAPPAAERLAVLGALARAGVPTALSLAPWIPGVSDVRALLAAARTQAPHAWVRVSPLNVRAPQVAASPFSPRWTQVDINRAFLAEQDANPDLDVIWSPPVPLTGHYAAQHCDSRLASDAAFATG